MFELHYIVMRSFDAFFVGRLNKVLKNKESSCRLFENNAARVTFNNICIDHIMRMFQRDRAVRIPDSIFVSDGTGAPGIISHGGGLVLWKHYGFAPEEIEISLERVARHHISHPIWQAAMIPNITLFLWGCLSQNQALKTGISNDIAQNMTGYDFSSMLWIFWHPLIWPHFCDPAPLHHIYMASAHLTTVKF